MILYLSTLTSNAVILETAPCTAENNVYSLFVLDRMDSYVLELVDGRYKLALIFVFRCCDLEYLCLEESGVLKSGVFHIIV